MVEREVKYGGGCQNGQEVEWMCGKRLCGGQQKGREIQKLGGRQIAWRLRVQHLPVCQGLQEQNDSDYFGIFVCRVWICCVLLRLLHLGCRGLGSVKVLLGRQQ